MTIRHISLLGIVALLLSSGPTAQDSLTIRERATTAGGKSLHIRVRQDSVPQPLAELATADFVVRGRLVRPRSYLSKDERHIWTDYDLVPTRVVLDKQNRFVIERTPGALPTLTVTLYGGELVVNGTNVTLTDLSREPWHPKADLLLFLRRVDVEQSQQVRPVAGSAGMFEIVAGDRLKALRNGGDNDRGIEGVPFEDLVPEILKAAQR